MSVIIKQKTNAGGFANYEMGDILDNKYIVIELLGKGTFSTVYDCALITDINSRFAIKVIRNVPKYRKIGEFEYNTLININKSEYIVELLDRFDYSGHIFLVFEKLGTELNQHIFIDTQNVLKIMKDLCLSIKLLNDNGYIHTDLKPENILFVDDNYNEIKLIDFNSVHEIGGSKSKVVTTINYRAPEVIRFDEWGRKIDVYSLGCIFYELITSEKLVETQYIWKNRRYNVHKHIKFIEEEMHDKITDNIPYDELAELIINMTETDPYDRLTIEESLVRINEIFI